MTIVDVAARVTDLEKQILTLTVRIEILSLPWWRKVMLVLGQTAFVMPNGTLWFGESVWEIEDVPSPIGELELKGRWSFLFGGCGCGVEEVRA